MWDRTSETLTTRQNQQKLVLQEIRRNSNQFKQNMGGIFHAFFISMVVFLCVLSAGAEKLGNKDGLTHAIIRRRLKPNMHLGMGNNTKFFGGGTPADLARFKLKDLTSTLATRTDYKALHDKSDGQLLWYIKNVFKQQMAWEAANVRADNEKTKPRVFVEFGARDGWYESNSWLLEDSFNFQGLLVEAGRDYIHFLREQRTCMLNGMPGACVFAALSSPLEDQLGQTLIWDKDDTVKKGESSSATKDRVVRSTTLNHLLHHFHVGHIDFMSADCEGCESAAFAGLNLQKHRVDFLTVENPDCLLQKRLHDLNYTALHVPFSYDSLFLSSALVAKMRDPPDTTVSSCSVGVCQNALVIKKDNNAAKCYIKTQTQIRVWRTGDSWPPKI